MTVENKPADAGAVTPPAGASPVTPPVVIEHEEGNEIMETMGPQGRAYIKQLRGEAKDHRLEKAQWKDKAETTASELAKMKADAETKERERLEKQQEFQELYTKEREGRMQDRQRLIDTEIKVLATEKQIPIKLAQKLLDKTGISIDSEGNITGMDRAWARMEEEHEDVFETVRRPAAKAASEDGEEDADKGKKAEGGKKVADGENYKKRVGAGGDPPPSNSKKSTVDARKMTREESDKAYADWRKKNGGR